MINVSTGAPECFVKDGKAFKGNKGQIVECLVPKTKETDDVLSTNYSVLVVDLSVEIRSKASIFGSKNYTYRDFVLFILDNIASAATSVNATQIDIVTDFYHNMSIKAGTRLERGSSSRVMFSLDDTVPINLADLLKNNDFKTDLNTSFSLPEILEVWSWQWDYCITNGKCVLERIDGLESQRILCINTSLEEADNRMVLHIRDAMILRNKHTILVRTVDSDVIIILLGFFIQFVQYNEQVKLCVDYGTGNFRRVININSCYENIGESNALALQFFHALSGCDSTSFIYKKSKAGLFNLWMHSQRHEELTEAFIKLSWLSSEETIQECLPILEEFLEVAYGGAYSGNLNEFRLKSFKASASNNLRELPPSRSGLELHVRRASYQAGWVWGNTVSQEPTPKLSEFGWTVVDGRPEIRWSIDGSKANIIDKVTKTCKCKVSSSSQNQPKDKCTSCMCAKAKLSCLEHCKCLRQCENSGKITG